MGCFCLIDILKCFFRKPCLSIPDSVIGLTPTSFVYLADLLFIMFIGFMRFCSQTFYHLCLEQDQGKEVPDRPLGLESHKVSETSLRILLFSTTETGLRSLFLLLPRLVSETFFLLLLRLVSEFCFLLF